jgi:hypothetical protein
LDKIFIRIINGGKIMATIDEELLGKLNGSLGKIVIKNNKGKRYVAAKPRSFIPGFDPESVARRDKFALAGRLSKRIHDINYLRTIWKKHAPVNTTPFNLITKTNYLNVNPSDLSDQVTLTPEGGFNIVVHSVQLNSSDVQAAVNAVGTNNGIDPVKEPYIVMASILFLNNPKDEVTRADAFITLLSAPQPTDLSTETTFNIPLSYQEKMIFNKYRDKKGFFSLITLDADDNPVNYSSTFVSS